jgi:hypothetical protein
MPPARRGQQFIADAGFRAKRHIDNWRTAELCVLTAE